MRILLTVTAFLSIISAMACYGNEPMNDFDIQPGKQTENWHSYQPDGSNQPIRTPFLLSTPKTYDANQPQPLLLFLHGLGESGDGDFAAIKKHGPPKLAGQGEDFPFVLVSPQCPVPPEGTYPSAWKADVLNALLDSVCEQMKIDPQRIYVTGLSMGGYGTWRLAAKYPQRFAAAAPICGGGETDWAQALSTIPIWAFHGAQDNVVTLDKSKTMVDAIQLAGGDVKLTVYPEAAHDSWTETYKNPKLYEWLLNQRRP